MKITKLVEFKNENGKTIYYKKMNGHKLTPEQLTYNQITKGLNYELASTETIQKEVENDILLLERIKGKNNETYNYNF